MSAARGLVCVVGSGGREHALAHCLARQGPVVLAPGRASMARPPRAQPSRPRPSEARPGPSSRAPVAAPGDELASLCYEISVTDLAPEEIDADLFVIGPEVPLVDGLADRLRHRGRLVVGPGADGAVADGAWARAWLYAHASTIFSGTNEIQRTLVGEQVLGLPRPPRPEPAEPATRGGSSVTDVHTTPAPAAAHAPGAP
jgi:hypothetical protein